MSQSALVTQRGAEKAFEEYHFEQGGVAAAIASAQAQIATALNR